MSTRNILIANNTVIQRTAVTLERLVGDEALPQPVREQLQFEIDRLRGQSEKNRRVFHAQQVIYCNGEIE